MALREKLNEMMDMMPSRKAAREASAEMKRESRGIPKPYNFDAIQDAIDANARKKISDMGYKKGGSVGSASKRADGCCIKGKTRGKMV